MVNNKYYTPTINEFRVGFECEFKNNMQDNVWNSVVCDVDLISIAFSSIEHDDIVNTFRVKYLDVDDIESFGFEEIRKDGWHVKGDCNIKKYPIGINIFIGIKPVFSGIIKNKSELEVLLKQLNIIQ